MVLEKTSGYLVRTPKVKIWKVARHSFFQETFKNQNKSWNGTKRKLKCQHHSNVFEMFFCRIKSFGGDYWSVRFERKFGENLRAKTFKRKPSSENLRAKTFKPKPLTENLRGKTFEWKLSSENLRAKNISPMLTPVVRKVASRRKLDQLDQI